MRPGLPPKDVSKRLPRKPSIRTSLPNQLRAEGILLPVQLEQGDCSENQCGSQQLKGFQFFAQQEIRHDSCGNRFKGCRDDGSGGTHVAYANEIETERQHCPDDDHIEN